MVGKHPSGQDLPFFQPLLLLEPALGQLVQLVHTLLNLLILFVRLLTVVVAVLQLFSCKAILILIIIIIIITNLIWTYTIGRVSMANVPSK